MCISNLQLSSLNPQDSRVIANEKKFPELGTNKSGVYFTTKALKALSTEFQEITETYTKAQSGVDKEIVGIAGEGCCLL